MQVHKYTRPASPLLGRHASAALHKWLGNGLRLTGGADDLGFSFLYELLTGTIQMAVNDTTGAKPIRCERRGLWTTRQRELPKRQVNSTK